MEILRCVWQFGWFQFQKRWKQVRRLLTTGLGWSRKGKALPTNFCNKYQLKFLENCYLWYIEGTFKLIALLLKQFIVESRAYKGPGWKHETIGFLQVSYDSSEKVWLPRNFWLTFGETRLTQYIRKSQRILIRSSTNNSDPNRKYFSLSLNFVIFLLFFFFTYIRTYTCFQLRMRWNRDTCPI